MKRLLLIILLMLMPGILRAYEPGTFNLTSPTNLEKGQGEFKIQHRFYGEVGDETLDTFFGMDIGANVGIGLRYAVLPGLDLNVARFRNRKEGVLGASYAYSPSGIPLRGQVDIQYFRYEEFDFGTNSEEKRKGVFGLFSLRAEPILNRITPVVNMGYDGYNEEFGAGLGLAVTVLENLGTIQKIIAVGEYFPTTSEDEKEQSLAFGVRIETYGHHFDLILHNNSELGARHLMSGTITTEGLRFGFNIKRLF